MRLMSDNRGERSRLSTAVRYATVMLSAAKHLARWAEMLRCAQHDTEKATEVDAY